AKGPKAKERQSKRSHRRNSRLTYSRVSGDRCGHTVGFSLSERRRCKGRDKPKEREERRVSPDQFRMRTGRRCVPLHCVGELHADWSRVRPSIQSCRDQSAGASQRRATPIPRGTSRPEVPTKPHTG